MIGTHLAALDRLPTGRPRGGAAYDPGVTGTPGDVPSNATAQAERHALADLLLEVGPDAPTCCTGWDARDLAAHLVVRERRPDAAAGIAFAALAPWTRQVQERTAAQDYARLVAQVRGGPPRWSAQSIGAIDAATNTIEFFVHHEDVRRAADDWEPRSLDGVAAAQLGSALARGGRVLSRHSPVGIVLRPTDGPRAGQEVVLREGERSVTLVGPVGECVLAVYGRPTRGLEVQGEPADVAAFRTFPR